MVFKLPKQIKSIYDCFLALKEIFIVFSDFKEPFSGAYFSISFVLTLSNFQGTILPTLEAVSLFTLAHPSALVNNFFQFLLRNFLSSKRSTLFLKCLVSIHLHSPFVNTILRFFANIFEVIL